MTPLGYKLTVALWLVLVGILISIFVRFGVAAAATPGPPDTRPAIVQVPGQRVAILPWVSVPGAKLYEIWLGGVRGPVVRATPGVTQGFAIPVRCGVTTRYNARASDGTFNVTTGDYVWGKLGTARFFTPPPCPTTTSRPRPAPAAGKPE